MSPSSRLRKASIRTRCPSAAYLVRATVEGAGITDVVISDNSLPEGMPIDAESIEVLIGDEPDEALEPTTEDNGFSVAIDELPEGSVVEVAYSARVEDEALAGTDVVNTVLLTADELDKPLSDDAVMTVPPVEGDAGPDDKRAAVPIAPAAPDEPAGTPPSSPAAPGKFIKTGDATMTIVAGTVGAALLAAAAAAFALKRKHAGGRTTHSQALARATEYGSTGNDRMAR